MIHKYVYVCDTCPQTTMIVHDDAVVGRPPTLAEIPDSLPCGFRGCDGSKWRTTISEGANERD